MQLQTMYFEIFKRSLLKTLQMGHFGVMKVMQTGQKYVDKTNKKLNPSWNPQASMRGTIYICVYIWVYQNQPGANQSLPGTDQELNKNQPELHKN